MSTIREFSLGAMLSVIRWQMLSPAGPSEIMELMCHLLIGPDPSSGTYEVNQADITRCSEELLRQHPWLSHVPSRSDGGFHHVSVWDWARLDLLEQKVGSKHLVRTMVSPSNG